MKEFKEKEAFSIRLKQLLSEKNWPTNSPTWLAKEFNIRFNGNSVSVQTANNWLLGNAIPSQDKLQILAAWLDASTQWLRFGELDSSIQQDSQDIHTNIQLYIDDLPKKFAKLTPKQKQLIYSLMEEFLSE